MIKIRKQNPRVWTLTTKNCNCNPLSLLYFPQKLQYIDEIPGTCYTTRLSPPSALCRYVRTRHTFRREGHLDLSLNLRRQRRKRNLQNHEVQCSGQRTRSKTFIWQMLKISLLVSQLLVTTTTWSNEDSPSSPRRGNRLVALLLPTS